MGGIHKASFGLSIRIEQFSDCRWCIGTIWMWAEESKVDEEINMEALLAYIEAFHIFLRYVQEVRAR